MPKVIRPLKRSEVAVSDRECPLRAKLVEEIIQKLEQAEGTKKPTKRPKARAR